MPLGSVNSHFCSHGVKTCSPSALTLMCALHLAPSSRPPPGISSAPLGRVRRLYRENRKHHGRENRRRCGTSAFHSSWLLSFQGFPFYTTLPKRMPPLLRFTPFGFCSRFLTTIRKLLSSKLQAYGPSFQSSSDNSDTPEHSLSHQVWAALHIALFRVTISFLLLP